MLLLRKSISLTTARINILGDSNRLKALAQDFVAHYETRIKEDSTIIGKAMVVSSNRIIAYHFYKEVIALRSQWGQVKQYIHSL